MVTKQIHYFLVLYEELNFTRAAKRCGVSQPSLTNGIQTLERLLGGELFHRSRSSQSHAKPTALADAIRPHVQRIVEDVQHVKAIADVVIVQQRRHTRPHPAARNI